MGRVDESLIKFRNVAIAAALCLAFAWTSGCAQFNGSFGGAEQNDGQASASAVRDPILQDIPKPTGFVLDADRSVAISSGQLRLAKCEYSGALSRSSVKRFYEEYMPSAGFTLRQWSLDQGEFSLRFESSSEICTIRAKPRSRSNTAVVVEIVPKPRGSAEREQKPQLRHPT